MKTFSEREKAAFRHKLAYLGKTVAPATLPKHMRQAIFLRLRTLINQVPTDFWPRFELLARLSRMLRKKTEGQHNDPEVVLNIYLHLKSNRLLTDNAYASAICSPTTSFATSVNQHRKMTRDQRPKLTRVSWLISSSV